jgi:transposase InsO family protein
MPARPADHPIVGATSSGRSFDRRMRERVHDDFRVSPVVSEPKHTGSGAVPSDSEVRSAAGVARDRGARCRCDGCLRGVRGAARLVGEASLTGRVRQAAPGSGIVGPVQRCPQAGQVCVSVRRVRERWRIARAVTRVPVAATTVFDFIEVFYNRERRQSTLGQRSPAEYERIHLGVTHAA